MVKQSSCEKPKRLRFAKNSHGKFFGKHNDSKVHNPNNYHTILPKPMVFASNPPVVTMALFSRWMGSIIQDQPCKGTPCRAVTLEELRSPWRWDGNWGTHLEDEGSHLGGYIPDV